MRYHPIQIYQLTVDIVNDFDLTWCLKKIERSCAAERLHITFMRWKQRQNVFCQAAFAPNQWNEGYSLHYHNQKAFYTY